MLLRHDLTFAFRRLRSSPGFTAAAVLTLALGIGANTTIFSLVNAVVFRPFGVERQNELVSFNLHTSKAEFPTISYPDYKDYRDRNTVLSGIAMYRFIPVNISHGGAQNTRLWGYEVTGNYFDMLGVQPIRGRLLHPDDDVKRGGHPVAVIAYSCWQAHFGGAADIAGKHVKIAGLDYTIVGVTPPAFIGTELVYTPEVFVPMAMSQQIEQFNWLDQRGDSNALAMAASSRVSHSRALKGRSTSLRVSLAANIPKTTRVCPSYSHRLVWPAAFCAEPSLDFLPY